LDLESIESVRLLHYTAYSFLYVLHTVLYGAREINRIPHRINLLAILQATICLTVPVPVPASLNVTYPPFHSITFPSYLLPSFSTLQYHVITFCTLPPSPFRTSGSALGRARSERSPIPSHPIRFVRRNAWRIFGPRPARRKM
jgi:hypothetical protein